ncbi:MAG: shikimate dehydrogenase [Synergistaceae bacterium]|jgi:shikimate dehydrogenase|nr:shikimate dehydrogenase [Synergistaceae bacterium]
MQKPTTYWADTEFYGLLGNPTRESLSAAMHNANFKALGMNALYTPYDVEEDGMLKILSALEALRFNGLNVTMPLKQKIIPHLDETDEIGSLCNAVNTLYWKNGKLCGANTDGFGFVHALKEQGLCDPAGKRCLMFGSGGAARGVAFALSRAGAVSIAVSGRASDILQIAELASDLNAYRAGVCSVQSTDPNAVKRLLRENELVVNTTPVGMAPNTDATPFDTSLLESRHRVCDVVYVPHETKLLREAKARGCKTLPGYWMMIWQGVEAFRRWTGGKEPAVEAMISAVLEHLTKAG